MYLKNAGKRLLHHPFVWTATAPVRRAGCVALTYHRIGGPNERFTNIPAPVFRAHMRWLRQNCDVIHPDELADRVAHPAQGRRPSVIVTFDDGYRDYYEQAYPILQEFGIAAINFLPTRFIDSGEPFWWDLLDTAVASTSLSAARVPSGELMRLDSRDAKVRYSRRWKAVLKQLPAPDEAPLLDEALAALHTRRDAVPVERQVMTWEQVREVAALTIAGGHTHNHKLMPFLDEGQLDEESTICRDRIEAETGKRPMSFAYPSGAWSEAAGSAVARAGYTAAFTTREGFIGSGSPAWMALNRIHAPSTDADLAMALAGWKHRA